MIDKLAGYKTQVRVLEKKLKEMDSTKLDPAKVKQITDALKDLKELIKEKEDKREQRKKQKEDASKEVSKEADSGSITTTTTSPAAPQAPGAMTTPSATTTPVATPDDQKSQCALCGGLTFPDYPSYQQHMEFTHASDVMPTTPGQKEDKLVASVDPVVNKVETDPKFAPGVIVPDSVKRHNDIVDRVEKDPKIAPHIISEKEEDPKFKLDDVVKPVRGAESTGKVMRWDGKPSDLVYVAWDSGPLSERDTFGGYYPHDLELFQEEPVEAMAAPMEKPACADCTATKEKQGDLKGKYEALLKDLKEERDIHYEQGNHSWTARLDQKILDLEKAIEEKFGNKKESGAQNAEQLTVLDHTPARANSGPDAGGKDEVDSEFQSEWAEPKIASATTDGLTYELAMDMSKEQLMALPTLSESQMDDLKFDDGRHRIWVSRMGVEDGAPEDNQVSFETLRNGRWVIASLGGPITQTTKISVFKKEFTATPITDQKKFGGYDISDATGKKILNIKSKDSQPMTKDQLEFCAKIELTRGLKQAKLVEKVAFLEPGSKVYIIASDKSGKRVKFASMEQGIRGWAPVSKFAFINKEGEMRKHKDHIDNTFGHNGKEILVDCPNGSGNMVWLPMGELLPITPPPATPESLNDLESEKQCPDCHGTFEGAEGETCPTCGRFAVQKTALKPALPPQILNRRMEVDASGCDQCAATMINGVFCHETGCPNQKRKNRFDDEDMDIESSLKIQAHIRHENGKWIVYNHDYTKRLGEYDSKSSAEKRLRQIEFWKRQGSLRPFSKKMADWTDPEWTTKKVGEFYDETIAEKFMMDNHLENGFYRKEGDKYIVYDDVPRTSMASKKKAEISEDMCFECGSKAHLDKEDENRKYYTCPKCNSGFVSKKHVPIWNYKKKAEVLSNPYQSLTDHITDMKSRMNQVQDRLQTAPVVKAAVEDAAPELDLPGLFADLTQGIELLETKLGGDENSDPEVHMGVEELENKLWELEEKLGLTPELSEHEKSESEHKEIVDDIEDKKKVNKSAIDVQVTDETLEEGTGTPPSTTIPATTTPVIQNVQPTDDDNLNVPVTMPSSPTPPGTKWVFDTQFNKYVIMPDGSNPGKTI